MYSVEIQLQKIANEYSAEVKSTSRKACRKVSRKLAKTLRSTSPKSPGGGEYASGWTVKQEDADTFIVYNKTKPSLTHLLEESHVIRNKYGTYGRTGPGHGQVVHIKPDADAAQEELMAEIEANL